MSTPAAGPETTGEGLTAMVTGASRGIGRAIAIALAEAGYDVAVTGRTLSEGSSPEGLPGSLESVAAAITGLGRRALAVPLDLLDTEALVPAVEGVLGHWGHLDVVVNNAIYTGPGGDQRFLDTDPAELTRRITANLTAQLLLSQPVLRAMAARGRGTLINISSGAGMGDPPGPVGQGGWAVAYGCAKGGFHRMAGIIAAELGPQGITCWNLEPGFVATERVQARSELGWIAQRGKPPEVVGAVAVWMLRQPPGALANGSTISAGRTARDLGLWSPPPRPSAAP